ncbi:MAG: DUF29 family protein [Cyanobacteriota bacterium]|nr:DUF29 family protein [Cyanobacteriota bacterium]
MLSVFDECYLDARTIAADETGLPLEQFPSAPPFTRPSFGVAGVYVSFENAIAFSNLPAYLLRRMAPLSLSPTSANGD